TCRAVGEGRRLERPTFRSGLRPEIRPEPIRTFAHSYVDPTFRSGVPVVRMVTIFIHRNGKTEQVKSLDRAWLNPASGVILWVDLAAPSIPESLILSDTFAFHPLSVEDASASLHYPKIEAYDGYLYVILHGIDFHAGEKGFATHDVDF